MAINKVEFGDQTLMDLTGDTVTPEDVLNGATFHDRAGVSRSGTASYPVTDVQVNNTSVLDGTVAKITQGTAATKDVPASGNASTSQVVMGNDTRLTDSRNAKDVYAWAKASAKPSYTASEVGAIATSAKGANGGVAELDSTGKVPSSQLPSFVDDVLEYDSLSNFPTTGEAGKIYIAKDTNKTYRWSGTAYVEISASLALGETSSTAYRGDRGKTAYDHSQVTSGNPHNVTKSDVGLGNVGNFKAVSTVASQGLTDTEKSNARANIGAGTSSLTIGTTSTTAAAGNHTHTTTIAADSGTSALNMAANTTYKLTAGGTSFIFKTPADGNTDTKVTQTATSTSANYEVLFSATADNTTRTEAAGKNSNLLFNPSTGNLQATQLNGVTIGSSPKFTDNNTTYTFATGDSNGQIKITPSGGTAQNVSVKGLGSAAYTASSAYAVSATLASDANLNSITTPGLYNAGGSNSITNKPSNVDAFGLEVIHVASGGWYVQMLYPNGSDAVYRRYYNSSTWSSWTQDKYTDTTYSAGSNITLTGTTFSLTKANVTGALGYTPPTTDTNTHRPIQVNGTEVLGNNTTALNLKAGSNVSLSNSNGTVTITASQPTVNNATLTIQKNGTTVKTFTANASSDVTANVTVPTKVSELTNDSGYITDVRDYNNNVPVRFGYSTSGMDQSAAVWIGAWESANNQYRLRAVNQSILRVRASEILEANSMNMGAYVSGDTHYLRLGYFDATGNYDNCTLLITSAFWGNQHGSADIINYQQSNNTNGSPLINETISRVHLGGNSVRKFFYKKESTNKVWLYVYVIGGNSYGVWNVTVLNSSTANSIWHRDLLANQPNTDLIEIGHTEWKGNAVSASNATNADKLDNYHWLWDRYTSYVDLTQPTANTEWGIVVSSNDWDRSEQVIQLNCSGNNRGSCVIVHTHSRTVNFWGYQTTYNGIGAKGIVITISNATNTHFKIPSDMTSVRVYKSFGGSAAVENLRTDYVDTNNAGLFTNYMHGTANNANTVNGLTVQTAVPANAVFTDTKNTAGSTDSSSKLFLIGATSQAANPQTYSHDTAYVGTDGCLYSGGTKVLTAHQSLDPIKHTNTDIPEGAANLSATATAHKITVYRNGLTIPYQMDNPNDGGILRVRGTSESNCILELGTWDDSGAGETIQFNYYPTTSQVTPTYSVSVPKKSGTIALTSDIPGVVSTTANGLAPKVTDTSKFLKGDGTWATPTNTTYSAGTGLSLSGTAFSTSVPRVTEDANTLPSTNTFTIKEYNGGSSHLPGNNNWSYMLTMLGSDATGGYQLNFSSLEDGIYFRRRTSGTWGSWKTAIPFYSSSVSAAVNATTCTISDSHITTSSMIEPFSSNSKGNVVTVTKMVVTAGQVVLTFPALSDATSFKVRITNV